MREATTKPLKLQIILVGDELLNGEVADKNARLLLSLLSPFSSISPLVQIVPDSDTAISEAIINACLDCEIIILSGGLGPTSDDKTLGALSKALKSPLKQCPNSLKRLHEKHKIRERTLNKQSEKQTFFPENSEVIINTVGTADSCMCTYQQSNGENGYLFALPGVPKEFEHLIKTEFLPKITQVFKLKPSVISKKLKCFGLPESEIAHIIEALVLPATIQISYRPSFPYTLLGLRYDTNNESEGASAFKLVLNSLKKTGSYISPEEEDIALHTLNRLLSSRRTIACAESCTGGLLSYEFTRHPGASKGILGSIIAYDNSIKERVLGIRKDLLRDKGAVSEEVVSEMARSIRRIMNSSYGLATSGIAGPQGGTLDKPVGTIHIALASEQGVQTRNLKLPWDREQNQVFTVWSCIHLLLNELAVKDEKS